MNVKEIIKKLKQIHVTVALGMSILAATVYLVVLKYGALAPNSGLSYEIAAIIVVFALLVASMLINKRQLNAITMGSLEDRLMQFHRASIIQYALIASMTFILCILYGLSGLNNVFLYALLTIVYFIYHRPHAMKIINELKLKDEEDDEIRASF